VAERQLLESFSRMLPELLRFSSANHLLELIPDEVQAHHRIASGSGGGASSLLPDQPSVAPQYVVANKARQRLSGVVKAPPRATGLWDGWEDAGPTESTQEPGDSDNEGQDDGIDLEALGL